MLAHKHVVVVCRRTANNADTWTYVLHLGIDEADHVLRDKPFYGKLMSGDYVYPCVVRREGDFDFGSTYEGERRFYPTNILKKPIRVGEFFTTNESDVEGIEGEEFTYVIERVERL